MSPLHAEKLDGHDPPGVQKEEERYPACRNLPEAGHDPDGPLVPLEASFQESQDSDCFPSVCLAAFLALLFLMASLYFLQQDGRRFRFHDCRFGSPNQTTSRLGVCPLFYPNWS